MEHRTDETSEYRMICPPVFSLVYLFPVFLLGQLGHLVLNRLYPLPLLGLTCPSRGGTQAYFAGTNWDTLAQER